MVTADLRTKPLILVVRTPEKTIYEGEAHAVSSVNERGPFDVLAAHQNFITLIREKLVITDTAGEKQEVPVQGGVMRVHENEITIFLGVEALRPDQEA
jgi:F-type H+-transporting ATPase subunit epsilon